MGNLPRFKNKTPYRNIFKKLSFSIKLLYVCSEKIQHIKGTSFTLKNLDSNKTDRNGSFFSHKEKQTLPLYKKL